VHDLELRAVKRALVCARGRPLLHIEASGRSIELPLSAPQSRIENMLPASLAPPGARAVWTGERLLVATPLRDGAGQRLSLSAFGCQADKLARAVL
jgi:hypothetical protein